MDLMFVEEVAKYVRVPVATIRWWIHTGTELGPKFRKRGRRRMVLRSDVDEWFMGGE